MVAIYMIEAGKALVELQEIVKVIWLWLSPSLSIVETVNMAKALAAELGVKWCNHYGYSNFTLELDSMIIANMLDNNLVTNMKLKRVLENIINIKNRVGIQVRHCFREGNQIANYLAKLASVSTQICSLGPCLIYLDRLEVSLC